VGGVLVVVVALEAFANVTYHRFLSSSVSKLAFFLCYRFNLGKHVRNLLFRRIRSNPI
jgi:hypothetical protein